MISPPSPTPPWGREPLSPLIQTCPADGTVLSLTSTLTLLDQAIADPPASVSLTIPDGTYVGQVKVIQIRGDKITDTETFIITGNFAAFTSLKLDNLGFNAILIWDGETWAVFGGNATATP